MCLRATCIEELDLVRCCPHRLSPDIAKQLKSILLSADKGYWATLCALAAKALARTSALNFQNSLRNAYPLGPAVGISPRLTCFRALFRARWSMLAEMRNHHFGRSPNLDLAYHLRATLDGSVTKLPAALLTIRLADTYLFHSAAGREDALQ